MVKIHSNLPQDLTGYELERWLKNSSIENFEDAIKRYFKPEQIAEFEHESSACGREINRLNALKAEMVALITKGNDEDDAQEVTFEIPVTKGTTMLEKIRRQNDDFVEKGFEIEERTVFGIINEKEETVEYFTSEGELIAERTRGLTPKEKMKHLGTLQTVSINRSETDLAANG